MKTETKWLTAIVAGIILGTCLHFACADTSAGTVDISGVKTDEPVFIEMPAANVEDDIQTINPGNYQLYDSEGFPTETITFSSTVKLMPSNSIILPGNYYSVYDETTTFRGILNGPVYLIPWSESNTIEETSYNNRKPLVGIPNESNVAVHAVTIFDLNVDGIRFVSEYREDPIVELTPINLNDLN